LESQNTLLIGASAMTLEPSKNQTFELYLEPHSHDEHHEHLMVHATVGTPSVHTTSEAGQEAAAGDPLIAISVIAVVVATKIREWLGKFG
jgi:hypothetical protein